ncbi:AfsR/SARP family transcriptional regulator [Phytohabitans aurantiacus]|uniref:SARP family transcriptional regulator n=1 Tax=Phytohabitans aurantiacus TaxID=3016789 RepID=A0ABQ5QU48_9ACTN|nr:BTAD domain-containing putative transcriptional regulator [Phytohabitans aurantiacus]GLH98111.1 SARP family transcriptional regulator [Phytohabitans aurantiacus]
MQVRLLGPVELTVGGVCRPVPGLRRKAVLAVLGLHPGHIVSSDRLIDLVWGGNGPSTAQNTLQRHMSYLRNVLGAKDAIVARPPGYVLNIGAEATDVETAERLIRLARQSSDPALKVRHLRGALALWRGRPLLDVVGLGWLDEQAERLVQIGHEAASALIEARLMLGEHADLVPELERLASARPFDEDVHRQLMVALYRSGRQVDALATYQRLRRSLGEELGIDPGQPLRELESAILRQDASLAPPAPAITVLPAPDVRVVPAQLPLAVPAFTARTREIARLDTLLARSGSTSAVVIAAVSGTAGVGKTALAVHWAHRVRDQFPDGQLYVNLRGFDPGGLVVDPAVALRGFLSAFGIEMDRIPAGVDAQAALYRSVLAGKRVLVVLDNARDAEQVRPLLPGSPGCVVVVTSRNQLTALVTAECAYPVMLDLLTGDESRDLLAHRLGTDRVAADPAATREVIERCARLPLALAIAAANCFTHPELPVASIAAQLRDSTSTLDALNDADVGTDIAAVFSWSYQALTPGAARLFRLLGLHPGPEVTAASAASLAGLAAAATRPLLAELVRAHLLMQPARDRHTLHDLLWTYAASLARGEESEPRRATAARRLLDHHLHTALSAGQLINPKREPIAVSPPAPGAVLGQPAGRDEAVAWFTAERAVLLAVIRQAPASGFDSHIWQLAWAAQDFLTRWGHREDHVASQRAAIDAAQRQGDLVAQARSHCGYSTACAKLHRYDEAHSHLRHALDLYEALGNHAGQAFAYYQMGWVSNLQGRHDRALGHARRALRLYRLAGHPVGVARTLNSLGWDHALCGDYERARPRCEQALAALRLLGDRHFEAGASDSLGYIYHHLGNYGRAVEHYRHAVELFRDVGDRYYEADALNHLGDSHRAAGDVDAARAAWRHALAIFDELGHQDAATIRGKLGTRPPVTLVVPSRSSTAAWSSPALPVSTRP